MIIEQFHDHIKLALLYGENTKCQVIFFVMIVLIRCWIVAVNNANRNLNLLDLTYSSQSIIGSGGYRPEDVTDVMNIMKSGRWNIEKIITDEFSIDDLDAAIRKAADSDHAFNVIVHFDDN